MVPPPETGAELRAQFANSIGSEAPLVRTLESFNRDGHTFGSLEWQIKAQGQTAISRNTLTPNADGRLTKMESTIWETDGTFILHGIQESGKPLQYTDSSGHTRTDNWLPARDFDTNLLDWLDVQINIIPIMMERGFVYAGRGRMLGRPSVRYEQAHTVIEFVKDNPALVRESRYTRARDGKLELEYQMTVTGFTVGKPSKDAGKE